ncbi:MAG TPA: transglycosylase domain-containing protein [Longimicrobium sp.]|nr:transglycosylase domain-containing protein [Longimicrobium sp.]
MRLFRARPRPDDDDVTQEWTPPRPPIGHPDVSPPDAEQPRRRKRGIARRVLLMGLKVFAAYYVFCVLLLIVYRFVWPPTTGVQLQRRIEAMAGGDEYQVTRKYVRLRAMSRHAPRAVVAAEDGRFWTHSGFDMEEMRNARRDIVEGGRMRGASTITQQLVKNLFGCACRNPVLGGIRKIYDWTLTPAAELILGKNRVLELYLNSAEWGDGVFGVDAAARHHYRSSARELTRSQAAGLAALLPNPHRRTTANTPVYRREILRRMSRRGW